MKPEKTDAKVGSKSAATKEKILFAAAELFMEQGYDGTSLRGIARHVDMNVASIYYYFETKDDIILEVLVRGVETLHHAVSKAVQELPKKATTRQKIESAIEAHLNCLAASGEFPAPYSIYLHLPSSLRQTTNPARERYFKLWLSLIEEGIASGEFRHEFDPSLVRRLILVGLTRSVEWEEINQRSVKELTKFFSSIFFDGLI